MSIQDISVSNSQYKKLSKAAFNNNIMVEGDDGELIVNVNNYKSSVATEQDKIIELIIGEKNLDKKAQYWVFK